MIPTNLEALRTQAGLTQTELALKSGVKQSVISAIESGQTKHPRIDTVFALVDALGCTIDDLFRKGN